MVIDHDVETRTTLLNYVGRLNIVVGDFSYQVIKLTTLVMIVEVH